MPDIAFLPLKTPGGELLGHARLSGNRVSLRLRRDLPGQAVAFTDGGVFAGPADAPLTISGALQAVAVEADGRLLCLGGAPGCAASETELRRRLMVTHTAPHPSSETPAAVAEQAPQAPAPETVAAPQIATAPKASAPFSEAPPVSVATASPSDRAHTPARADVQDTARPVFSSAADAEAPATDRSPASGGAPLRTPGRQDAARPVFASAADADAPATDRSPASGGAPLRTPGRQDTARPVFSAATDAEAPAADRAPAPGGAPLRTPGRQDAARPVFASAADAEAPATDRAPASGGAPLRTPGRQDAARPVFSSAADAEAPAADRFAAPRAFDATAPDFRAAPNVQQTSPDVPRTPAPAPTSEAPAANAPQILSPADGGDGLLSAPDDAAPVWSARREPDSVADSAADSTAFMALLRRADAVFRTLDTPAPPAGSPAPHRRAVAHSAPTASAEDLPSTASDADAWFTGAFSAPDGDPSARTADPAPDAGAWRPRVLSAPADNDAEHSPRAERPPCRRRDAWCEQVDALLELPASVGREHFDNPFPHIFPNAQFTLVRGGNVMEHLEGDWLDGGTRRRILAVRGDYAPEPPKHLFGFTRYIRTRIGGFWVKVL